MHIELPNEIQEMLNEIHQNIPSITEIWLIGSRANNAVRENSDWDFLAFGDDSSLNSLKNMVEYKRENIDFLVVFDGDNFVESWGGETPKLGSLTKWKWNRTSDYSAEYEQIKFIPDSHSSNDSIELGAIVEKKVNAVRVVLSPSCSK